MALKYCQSHKCHTYDTKDRKRGSKGNKVNQTRRRSDFYYGGGNFCSLNCFNDWSDDFMNRAIDSISGRLNEPLTLTEENAWRKTRRYNWDRTNNVNGYSMTYFGITWFLIERLKLQKKNLKINPNLIYSFICP